MNDTGREGSGASGRIPEDAPGGIRPASSDGWDDAMMDRFWLGVYARLERGLAWVLVSASAALLIGYWAHAFVTEFMTSAEHPIAVRIGVAGLLAGVLLLLLGVVRERIRDYSRDPFRRVRR